MSIYKLTADELAPDIYQLLMLYREGKIHEAIVRQVLKGACWWVSNGQGKKDACDLWSKEALTLRNTKGSWRWLGLVHEHIVPRNEIEENIMQLEIPSIEGIANLLKHSRVCIVTKTEDDYLREKKLQKKLPDADSLHDAGNLRYAIAEIEFSEVSYLDQ